MKGKKQQRLCYGLGEGDQGPSVDDCDGAKSSHLTERQASFACVVHGC